MTALIATHEEEATMTQMSLDGLRTRPKGQVFKWLGSKFKYAYTITSFFPPKHRRFIEPFVGTGAILATMAPQEGIAGDALGPLIEVWKMIQEDPQTLIDHYTETVARFNENRKETYLAVRERYNESPNGLDLLILSRTCYGGVIRFTKKGKMSTPPGVHRPMKPETFAAHVKEWRSRVQHTTFYHQSFEKTMAMAEEGDLVYCDPPYVDSQRILYGAQEFRFASLLEAIEDCKRRGVMVVLSIDGSKKSGRKEIALEIPEGLFDKEVFVNCGHSMLNRFQRGGKKMEGEVVQDRLLFTWPAISSEDS